MSVLLLALAAAAPLPPSVPGKAEAYRRCAAMQARQAPTVTGPALGGAVIGRSPRPGSTLSLFEPSLGFADCLGGLVIHHATAAEREASLRSLPGFVTSLARMKIANPILAAEKSWILNGRFAEVWNAGPDLRYAVVYQELGGGEAFSPEKGAVCVLEINLPQAPRWNDFADAFTSTCSHAIAPVAQATRTNAALDTYTACLKDDTRLSTPECIGGMAALDDLMRAYSRAPRRPSWPAEASANPGSPAPPYLRPSPQPVPVPLPPRPQ